MQNLYVVASSPLRWQGNELAALSYMQFDSVEEIKQFHEQLRAVMAAQDALSSFVDDEEECLELLRLLPRLLPTLVDSFMQR